MTHLHDRSVPALAPPRLSKSKFTAGLQCLKRVYLEVHEPHLATPPDPGTRAILNMGTEIGELARRSFAGGILVEPGYRSREAALARTDELVREGTAPAIFEGAFLHDGVLVRVDVLERTAGEDRTARWRLIEVKSSARPKDVHLDDLAIQTYVLIGAGVPLAGVGLMHVNTRYVYEQGAVDLGQLFTILDVTESVFARQTKVAEHLAAMKAVLLAPHAPAIEPGPQCHVPYECPFWAHCTADKPGRWIFHLPGSKQTAAQLSSRGILVIDDIPDTVPLSPSQRRVRDNVEWISPGLREALQAVEYPVHHVDFETIMLAVPRFPSTRPYQSIPVQWSNHIELESGELRHEEFLHDAPSEPRRRWADALIESLGDRGSICVYSSYERAIMEQLAEALPEYASVFRLLIKRLWDLLPIIREHYYHPAFQGSYSIKAVLPAVVPSLGYGDLSIQDGGQAASAYYRMVFVEMDWIEQAAIRDALRRYCARDTLAMVALRKALLQKTMP